MSYKSYNDKLFQLEEAKRQCAKRLDKLTRTGRAERPNHLYYLPKDIKGLTKNITKGIDKPM